MKLHYVLTSPISVENTLREQTYPLELLKRLRDTHQVASFQIWATVGQAVQKESLEAKAESFLTNLLARPVECIFIEAHSDFDELMIVVDRYMHWLAMHEPYTNMGLYIDSLDLLAQAVLVEGVKTFESRFCSVYGEDLQNYEDSPYQASWLQLFQATIHEYDYGSALAMLENFHMDDVSAVRTLLHVQNARLNFDFVKANEHMQKVEQVKSLVLLQTKMIVQQLSAEPSQETTLAQITELYRHIKVFLTQEDWSSFLIRFYRAREAVMHYIRSYGPTIELPTMRTSSIYQLVEQLEEAFQQRYIQQFYGAYFYTKSANVADALMIRNKSLIGHSRQAINTKQLMSNYYGTSMHSSQMPERFLTDTAIMLRELGSDLDDNFVQMNQLIIEQMSKIAEVIKR